MGQRLLAANLDLLPDVPVAAEMIAVEGAKGADSLVEGVGFEFALILQVYEEVENLLRAERGEVGLGEMIGELANPAVVGAACTLREAFKLDEAGEVLIPLSRSDRIMFFS